MVDRAILELTGKDSLADAWRTFVSPDDVVGIKLNLRAGRYLSTQTCVTDAIVAGLTAAGVPENNIIAWDAWTKEFPRAGYTLNTSAQGVRYYASDKGTEAPKGQEGRNASREYLEPFYTAETVPVGDQKVQFTKILTEEITALINVPLIKDHSVAGVTCSMKNHYGSILKPRELHGDSCNPYLAELNAAAPIRDKTRLILVDGLRGIYNGGPYDKPQWRWRQNCIIAGTDNRRRPMPSHCTLSKRNGNRRTCRPSASARNTSPPPPKSDSAPTISTRSITVRSTSARVETSLKASGTPSNEETYMRTTKLNRFLCVVMLLAAAGLGLHGIAHAAEAAPDPEKPGPYPTGVTTTLLVDPSRTDPTTNGPRTLVTEIWYPATDDSRGLPKNRLLDFFFKGTDPTIGAVLKLAFNTDLEVLDKTFQNFSVRDARVRDGIFPLILFSHGNGGLRMQNAFWCEHMASHGYIVVSPDHTGNCGITSIAGELVPYNPQGRDQSATDRPKDLSFLIDVMERMNKGADSRFFGKLDLEHIGVAGHSFGGYAATAAADQDPRVDAIAPMAAVARERTRYDCPAMMLLATEDDTIGLDGNERIRTYYNESKGPRYLIEFVNGGHYFLHRDVSIQSHLRRRRRHRKTHHQRRARHLHRHGQGLPPHQRIHHRILW